MKTVIGATCLAIVLSASQASAACAWVVWEHRDLNNPKEDWRASKAFSTQRECDQRVMDSLEWDITAKVKPIALYKCLPDTIDPRERGPKGK
jgi:hypothetical protein